MNRTTIHTIVDHILGIVDAIKSYGNPEVKEEVKEPVISTPVVTEEVKQEVMEEQEKEENKEVSIPETKLEIEPDTCILGISIKGQSYKGLYTNNQKFKVAVEKAVRDIVKEHKTTEGRDLLKIFTHKYNFPISPTFFNKLKDINVKWSGNYRLSRSERYAIFCMIKLGVPSRAAEHYFGSDVCLSREYYVKKFLKQQFSKEDKLKVYAKYKKYIDNTLYVYRQNLCIDSNNSDINTKVNKGDSDLAEFLKENLNNKNMSEVLNAYVIKYKIPISSSGYVKDACKLVNVKGRQGGGREKLSDIIVQDICVLYKTGLFNLFQISVITKLAQTTCYRLMITKNYENYEKYKNVIESCKITEETIIKTYFKYKEIIDIYTPKFKNKYGDKNPYKEKTDTNKLPTTETKQIETEIEKPKYKLSLTPEQVENLVDAYNHILKTTKESDDMAVNLACKEAGIRAYAYTVSKALFGHQYIDGYKHIPRVIRRVHKASTTNPEIIKRIHNVRDLAMSRKTREEICDLTCESTMFVNGILDGCLYADIA